MARPRGGKVLILFRIRRQNKRILSHVPSLLSINAHTIYLFTTIHFNGIKKLEFNIALTIFRVSISAYLLECCSKAFNKGKALPQPICDNSWFATERLKVSLGRLIPATVIPGKSISRCSRGPGKSMPWRVDSRRTIQLYQKNSVYLYWDELIIHFLFDNRCGLLPTLPLKDSGYPSIKSENPSPHYWALSKLFLFVFNETMSRVVDKS